MGHRDGGRVKGVIALGSSEMSVVMKVVMTHCVSMQTVPAERLNSFLTTVSMFRALVHKPVCVCVRVRGGGRKNVVNIILLSPMAS